MTDEPTMDTEAERAIIHLLLMGRKWHDRLRPEHFGNPNHGRLFEAMQRTKDTGKVIVPMHILREIPEADTALRETFQAALSKSEPRDSEFEPFVATLDALYQVRCKLSLLRSPMTIDDTIGRLLALRETTIEKRALVDLKTLAAD